jgi:CysZ protein
MTGNRGPLGSAARFFAGAAYLFRGIGTLVAGGGLRRWAVLPLLVNALLFTLVGAVSVWAAAHYASSLVEEGNAWLGALAGVLAFLLVLVIFFFTFGLLAPLVAAPFNELLSQATERRETGASGEIRDRSFAADMLRAAWSATKLFLLEMAVVCPALLLLLIPLVGKVLFALPTSFFLALNYVDYPLDRRKLGLLQKLAFCWRHFAETMGFGLATCLIMLVPFVNVLMIPVAVVGATRLFVSLCPEEVRSGYLPAPPGAAPSEPGESALPAALAGEEVGSPSSPGS